MTSTLRFVAMCVLLRLQNVFITQLVLICFICHQTKFRTYRSGYYLVMAIILNISIILHSRHFFFFFFYDVSFQGQSQQHHCRSCLMTSRVRHVVTGCRELKPSALMYILITCASRIFLGGEGDVADPEVT